VLLYLGLAYAEVGRFQDAVQRLGAACVQAAEFPGRRNRLGWCTG